MARLLFFLFFVAALGWYVARVVRKFAGIFNRSASVGLSALQGATGRALTPIATEGSIAVQGEVWKACTRTGIIDVGATVKVVGVRPGMVLEVQSLAGGGE